MKRKYGYTIIIVIITIGLYYAENYVDKFNEDYPDNNSTEASRVTSAFDDSFLPTSTTGVIVKHAYYSLSYSETHEQAEWVAYELKKEHLKKNNFERPYFVEDRSVKTKSANYKNYKNSGYDRGHLCPAGDRKFSYNAYHETFLTSNISPQNHDFNAGVWNSLEQKIRFWAEKFDGVYVITGGVLKNGLKRIGEEEVAVPQEFYKIVIDVSEGGYKAIAFLIPNRPTDKSFYEYAVAIDEIEHKTGINFFSNLSRNIEKELESSNTMKPWRKR
ncbi:MAG: endonuclease G [Ulvibacter sp.]|jgi:endonuclease G